MTLTTPQMRTLPDYFRHLEDPRRWRRHSLPSVLSPAIATALAGMRGFKEISECVQDHCQAVLTHFKPRLDLGR